MKVYIAFVVLLGLFHLNKGCLRRGRRQPRPKNPKIIVSTTAAAQTQETTRIATTQSADVATTEKATTTASTAVESTLKATTKSPEVTTTEKATTVPQATTQNSEATTTEKATTVPPATTQNSEATTEKATTVPPATTQNSEATTTERNVAETTGQINNVDTTSQSAQLTRPSSIFGFRKSFGLPNVVNTESCQSDLNGTCRVECKDNEYLRGRFDCQGTEFNMNCCVLR